MDECKSLHGAAAEAADAVALAAGVPLVHDSAQSEPFLVTGTTEPNQRVPQRCLRRAEKWTSVSPWVADYFNLAVSLEALSIEWVGPDR